MASKTLWQILTEKKQIKVPVESTILNPFDLKIGNLLEIELENLDDVNFTVKGIRELTRIINGEYYKLTDYELYAKPYGQDPIEHKLRVIPKQNDEYDIVLFSKINSFVYDQNFHEGLNNNPTLEDGVVYERVNGLTGEIKAASKFLYDKNNDGIIDYNDFENSNIVYWDFIKEVVLEGNLDINPSYELYFYLVEMNSDNGFFELFNGRLIDSQRIKVK
jgi:hypothetical protein